MVEKIEEQSVWVEVRYLQTRPLWGGQLRLHAATPGPLPIHNQADSHSSIFRSPRYTPITASR